ncbi:Possible surface protein, responsible for cell interaction; contains cell adhesion domain and ChW-repeats [Yersinia phage fHe-Yen9-03]|uniref:Possible surface protein, responsible for cell interaction contains cell adhesion domain and ChW-repeats n=1 Tax=Yersinia phage fHe-Yen9-03 TaxID=2052743 RepID=A0A2C9CYG4_9CAUD|nr:Possible surface protein, responsible for cell interaction; contains cell adhesion domain and ChW-repeats [Yersinia phage fHe-Yen9-03]
MGKPIAGVYRLPFGTTGIIVHGAKLQNGTLIKNLRILKQRSSTRFDLIDVSNLAIHRKVSITGTTSTGVILDPTLDDDDALAAIPTGSFFIRVLNEDDDTVGYCTKLYNNLVHMSNSETFFVPNYNIFYAPSPEPSAPVYVPNGEKAAFVKASSPNTLLIGNGNSAASMVTATDGIIQLAMAARLWQPAGTGSYNSVVVPVDSTYTIKLDATKGQEFTIPFSIGILSSEFIGRITDLYDVTMTFYGNPDGQMTADNISWHLEVRDGTLAFIDYRFGRNIKDNAVTPGLTVAQNIQRYKFYLNNFLEQNPPPGRIPTGLFVGTIVAKHLITGDVLELKVMLDATYL